VNKLRANMVRVKANFCPIKAKIANAEQTRVHTMLVIGGRDMEAGAVFKDSKSPSSSLANQRRESFRLVLN
jgi:threonyl-tRNA synthetase